MSEPAQEEIQNALDGLMNDWEAAAILGRAYRALRAALAERDARIAALTEAATALLDAARMYAYTEPGKSSLALMNAELAMRDALAPPPYPSASDQYTHTHHYPHGDGAGEESP